MIEVIVSSTYEQGRLVQREIGQRLPIITQPYQLRGRWPDVIHRATPYVGPRSVPERRAWRELLDCVDTLHRELGAKLNLVRT